MRDYIGTGGGADSYKFDFRWWRVVAYVHLTDAQRKAIIADRVNGMTFRAIAKKHKTSATTVQRILNGNPETVQRVAEKKEQNTIDMFAFMDSQKGKVQEVLENIVIAMNNPEKLAKTSPRDLATAYGILVDKYCMISPKDSEEMLNKAKAVLGNIDGAIK